MQFDHRPFHRTPTEYNMPMAQILAPRVSKQQSEVLSPEALAFQLRIIHDVAVATISKASLGSSNSISGTFHEEITKTRSHETRDISAPVHCTKTQAQPFNREKNQRAAVMIQKLMRGWLLRLRFRILFLRNKLDSQKERTVESINVIQDCLQKEKAAFLKKMQKQAKKKARALEDVARKTYATIIELRTKNEHLKEENDKLSQAIQILRTHNEKLVYATTRADAFTSELGSHVVQIQKSNEMLRTLIPKFQSTIGVMEESMEVGQRFHRSERTSKVMYLKVIGQIVETMEDRCSQDDLVYDVVEDHLENMENSIRPIGDSK